MGSGTGSGMMLRGWPSWSRELVSIFQSFSRTSWSACPTGARTARMVSGVTKRAMSSMCPSVSSPSRPAAIQMTWVVPRVACSCCSIWLRVSLGLRLWWSRHDSVVRSVPLPLTPMEPPSKTMSWRQSAVLRCAAILWGTELSLSQGSYFLPQALKRKLWQPSPPRSSTTKIGP